MYILCYGSSTVITLLSLHHWSYQGISEFIATVLAWSHGSELPVSRIATLIVLLYIIYIYIFFFSIPYNFYHCLISYSSYCSIIMHLYIFLVSTLSRIKHSSYFISGFGAGSKMIDPHVILAMPFNFILRSSHLYYRNTQFLLWQCHLT